MFLPQVDATEEKELGTRFGITGFPSLKYFPAGEADMEAFNGGRDLDSMVGFLNSKVRCGRLIVGTRVLNSRYIDEGTHNVHLQERTCSSQDSIPSRSTEGKKSEKLAHVFFLLRSTVFENRKTMSAYSFSGNIPSSIRIR